MYAQSPETVEYTESIFAEGLDPLNKSPTRDTKQSDGEFPGMMGLLVMRSTPSLSLLPHPLWSGMETPDRVLSTG